VPRQVPRFFRRALLVYAATIVVPTGALVWLGVQSFARQAQALQQLHDERLREEIAKRTHAAAVAALADAAHPLAQHRFRLEGGAVVEPALYSPPRRIPPPEIAHAEHEELALQRPDQALLSYRRLIGTRVDQSLVRAGIARCLMTLGREAEARAAWRALAADAPDDRDLAHRPFGIVAAIQAGDTAHLYDEIERGRWDLPADQAEYFLETLDPDRRSPYLDRFTLARVLQASFAPASTMREGEVREYTLEGRRLFYTAAGPARIAGFSAEPRALAEIAAAVQRELPHPDSSGAWLYGGAIALMLLVLSAGVLLIWRDVARETRTNRLHSDFVSGVTHELKTPITLVRLYAETLLRQRRLDDAARVDAYRVIARESARLGRLIDHVLSFSRIERGETTYQFEIGDVTPVLATVVDDYGGWLERAGVRLECALPDTLPPVRHDASAIAQAAINLIDNAVKYSGSAHEIAVRAAATGTDVVFEVEDRGVGIPAEEQPRIFERFYRVANGAAKGGYGLGLYMVRQIARAHGGDVSVRSEPGRGSTFTVRLPIAADS
jgi:signal transduction histidine kinase